jgi:hypothetical protein
LRSTFILFTKPLKKRNMEQEQIVLTFYEGRNGRIIANSKEGKVCLLDFAYCKQNRIYVKFGEDWRCAIKEEKEHSIIVQPITRTLTAEENEKLFEVKKEELKNKFNRH